MMRRRQFLEYLLAGTAAAAVYRPQRRVSATGPGQPRPPRYFVSIHQYGGIDGIWSLDPKEPTDVNKDVDLPYKSADIVGTKSLRLGPNYKGLVPWASQMAVLRGVRLYTANHDTGNNQHLRFRTNWSYAAPSLVDVIGSTRDTQAISALYLGAFEPMDLSPTGMFGEANIAGRTLGEGNKTLLSTIDHADPEDLKIIAKGLMRQADYVGRTDTSLGGQRTRDSWRSAATFLDRVSELPKFVSPLKERDAKSDLAPEHFARAAWALEHDLTRCVNLKCYDFDTHDNNTTLQAETTAMFLPLLTGFLEKLKTTRNEYGSLLDQTMIVIGSEVGRFPRINTDGGKDHFPEASFGLIGAGFNRGTGDGIAFGGTGRDLASLPIDPQTGQVANTGLEVDLDDLGTSLVQLAGVDPRRFGYSGRMLPFLSPRAG